MNYFKPTDRTATTGRIQSEPERKVAVYRQTRLRPAVKDKSYRGAQYAFSRHGGIYRSDVVFQPN